MMFLGVRLILSENGMPIISREIRLRNENMYVHSILLKIWLLSAHWQNEGIEQSTAAYIHTMLLSAQVKSTRSSKEVHSLAKIQTLCVRIRRQNSPRPTLLQNFMFTSSSSDQDLLPISDQAAFADQMLEGSGGQWKQLLH